MFFIVKKKNIFFFSLFLESEKTSIKNSHDLKTYLFNTPSLSKN